jgi:hypothetical protein
LRFLAVKMTHSITASKTSATPPNSHRLLSELADPAATAVLGAVVLVVWFWLVVGVVEDGEDVGAVVEVLLDELDVLPELLVPVDELEDLLITRLVLDEVPVSL